MNLPVYEVLPDYLEISPATVIHPDAAAVVAPAVALAAGRVAALFHELYAPAPGVSRAVVPVHVIGGARNELVLPAALVAVAISIPVAVAITTTIPATPAYRKISPAAVINPNSPVIRAPTITFAAGGLTTLLN